LVKTLLSSQKVLTRTYWVFDYSTASCVKARVKFSIETAKLHLFLMRCFGRS